MAICPAPRRPTTSYSTVSGARTDSASTRCSKLPQLGVVEGTQLDEHLRL